MLQRVLIGVSVGAISLVSFGTVAGASNTSEMNAWAKQSNAGPIMRKVVQDAGAFVKAADAASHNKLLSACKNLSRDVPAAKRLPTIPVKSFQSLVSRSLTDLSNGATTCLAAFTASDEEQTSRAKSLAEKGARQVNAGIGLLQKFANEA